VNNTGDLPGMGQWTSTGGPARTSTTRHNPLFARSSAGMDPDRHPLGQQAGTKNISGRTPTGRSGKGGDPTPNKPERTTTNQGRNPLRLK